MSQADPNDFTGLADWEDHAASTGAFLPLMDLLERFALFCFKRDLTFFVDSGTLLGTVRHRSIIPWDYDVDLGMSRAQFRRLVEQFDDPPGLRLDSLAYGEPDASICVVPPAAGEDDPYLDVSCFEPDGRALMSEPLQRRWPLDQWRASHSERSWSYDFAPGELEPFVALPAWCGLLHAPAGWQRRLDRHYDSWHARPQSLARAAHDLPFDPSVPAVRLAPAYRTLEEGLADTSAERPFVVRACKGFSFDSAHLEQALREESSQLLGYAFDGPRADQQRTPLLDPGEAVSRFRSGTLDVNVTESRVTTMRLTVLPDALRAAIDPADPYGFSYLMTARGTDTPFHWDRDSGGGYLYMTEGEKYWMFMPGDEVDDEGMWGRSMTDLLSADGFRLWGRVQVIHQRAGDLVVFPVAWRHRVLTYQAALGVGGYLRLDLPRPAKRSRS